MACGRLSWPDAIATGRVHASGDRTDLSSHLRTLLDEDKLHELLQFASDCPDLEAFRSRLTEMTR